MAGPTVRYEVGLDPEADGNRFDVSTPKPAIRPSMGCDDEEIVVLDSPNNMGHFRLSAVTPLGRALLGR